MKSDFLSFSQIALKSFVLPVSFFWNEMFSEIFQCENHKKYSFEVIIIKGVYWKLGISIVAILLHPYLFNFLQNLTLRQL